MAEYSEGDWFAVPLEGMGYAVGLIARMSDKRAKSKTIFGYFFGPRLEAVPDADYVDSLSKEDAVDICMFGDLGLHNGTWIKIGASKKWNREFWPMPAFGRTQLVSGATFLVKYAEDDPGKVSAERRCTPEEIYGLPKDGLSGAGSVETYLSHMLAPK